MKHRTRRGAGISNLAGIDKKSTGTASLQHFTLK